MRRLFSIPGANTIIKKVVFFWGGGDFDQFNSKMLQLSLHCTECLDIETPHKYPALTKTLQKHYSAAIYIKNRSWVNAYKGRKQLSQMPKCLKHELATCISIKKWLKLKQTIKTEGNKKKIFHCVPLCWFLHHVSYINTAQSTLKRYPCWEPVPIHYLSAWELGHWCNFISSD